MDRGGSCRLSRSVAGKAEVMWSMCKRARSSKRMQEVKILARQDAEGRGKAVPVTLAGLQIKREAYHLTLSTPSAISSQFSRHICGESAVQSTRTGLSRLRVMFCPLWQPHVRICCRYARDLEASAAHWSQISGTGGLFSELGPGLHARDARSQHDMSLSPKVRSCPTRGPDHQDRRESDLTLVLGRWSYEELDTRSLD